LTPDDLSAFYSRSLQAASNVPPEDTPQKPKAGRAALYLWGSVPVIFAWALIVPRDVSDAVSSFVFQFLGGFLGVLAAALFIYRLFQPRVIHKSLQAKVEKVNAKALSERLLVISPDGIATTEAWSDTFLRWGGIEEIVKTETHLFLYENAPEVGFIIPRRVFPDQQSYDEFSDLAQKYHTDSKLSPQAPASAPASLQS
jgi:hypothetical protein